MNVEVFSTPITTIEYLELAHKSKWTGTIRISIPESDVDFWTIYFISGQIMWCEGGTHWRRRWRRLLYQYCPHISIKNITLKDSCADYYQLKQWSERGLLMLNQIKQIVQSNFAEVLFDLLLQESWLQQKKQKSLNFNLDKTKQLNSYLPGIDLKTVLNAAKDDLSRWCEVGLKQISPNCVPSISLMQQKELLHHVGLKIYKELVEVIDSEKTLRDIALVLRQPLLGVSISLYILFKEGFLQMHGVSDLPRDETFPPLSRKFISVEDFLSNTGVICNNCGCGSNSITASVCIRCNLPLTVHALPASKKNNFSKKIIVSTLLLLLGGIFVLSYDFSRFLPQSIENQNKSDCIK